MYLSKADIHPQVINFKPNYSKSSTLKPLKCDVVSFQKKQDALIPDDSAEIKFNYIVTNRGIETLEKFYPEGAIDGLEDKKILDIGCGGGKFVKELSLKGLDIVGVDESNPNNCLSSGESTPDYVLDREDIKNGLFKYASATTLPFENETFDRIFSSLSVFFEKYEHPKYQIECMKEAKRVLKPDGQMYLYGYNKYMEDIVRSVGGLNLERFDDNRFLIVKHGLNTPFEAIKPYLKHPKTFWEKVMDSFGSCKPRKRS